MQTNFAEAPVNVLLVDDEQENLLVLEAVLSGLSLNFVRAHSGEEALAKLLDDDFAVVLLDVRMRGLDGFQTARMIRSHERSRHIPIIFLTAYDTSDFPPERAYALGAVDYLQKPFVPEILQAKVAVFVDLFRKAERIRALERQQYERRQAESEQRFSRFMQHLPGLAWIKDLSGRYVYVNDAAERAFGMPREKLYGKTDAEIFPPATAAQFQENDRRALASETGIQAIETLQHDDGIVHHSIISKFPIPGLNGTPSLIGGMAIDITEQKRAEEALRESEYRLRLAQEAGRMGTWEWNIQTNKVFWSPALEQIHGLSPGTFPGTFDAFQRDIHPDDREKVLNLIQQSLATGRDYRVEYRIRQPDGDERWLEGRGKSFADEAGKPVRMVGVCMDITRRKRVEMALREADRRKDEFLASLAHELRNPLAPIRNSLHVLRLVGGGPAAEPIHEMMERQVSHLVRLVDDLLEVSRITRGKIELRKERIELASVVESAIETARPLIDAAHHELNISLPSEPVFLHADPVRLAQVIGNLLNNAAKYTEEGGRIWLTAELEASRTRAGSSDAVGGVAIRIRDTGIGIPADMLSHVFDIFTQVDHSLKRAQGGLGIGLTLVRSLVEMHGGRVEARSAGPSQGSEFIVHLPLAEVDEAATSESQPTTDAPARVASRRILVVDDNRDAANSLAMLLKLMGNYVSTVYDGPTALDALASYRPAVVVLDIGMPGMDGYEVARRIRDDPEHRDVTLIALTGWGQEEDRRRSRQAGFDYHLIKPVAADALQALLASLKGDKAAVS